MLVRTPAMRAWSVLGLVVFQAACAGGPPAPPDGGGAAPRTARSSDAAVERATLPPLVTSARAKVTLSLSKATSFLGENILVDYCIENLQKTPLVIEVGGDYRGASRSLRFELTMVDTAGAEMPDPDPARFSEGGLGYSPSIAPGASWCQSLPLVRYARFDQPGAYTLRVVHDLGWPKGTAPGGETTLTLKSPSAGEAEGVIRAMEALPTPRLAGRETSTAARDPSGWTGGLPMTFCDSKTECTRGRQ